MFNYAALLVPENNFDALIWDTSTFQDFHLIKFSTVD